MFYLLCRDACENVQREINDPLSDPSQPFERTTDAAECADAAKGSCRAGIASHVHPVPQKQADQPSKSRKPLTQLHLDCGQVRTKLKYRFLLDAHLHLHTRCISLLLFTQANFMGTKCKECGLMYVPGEEQDEKMHRSFHTSQMQGIKFPVKISLA